MVTLLAWAWLMPLMKKVDFLWTAVSIVFALLIAVLFAVAYKRLISVRIFTTALSPAIIVVPTLFLFNTDVRESVIETDSVYPTVSVQEGPPIVMIVFDEFPTSSLLNAKSEIDEMAYPNIASLSKTSTWYRNASTVSSETKWQFLPLSQVSIRLNLMRYPRADIFRTTCLQCLVIVTV